VKLRRENIPKSQYLTPITEGGHFMDTEALRDIGYGMYFIGSEEDSKFDVP
jgi:hypothetical protein